MKTSAVALQCGVTAETVIAWMKAGVLSATKTPGGHYRFDSAEVDALMKDDEARAESSVSARRPAPGAEVST